MQILGALFGKYRVNSMTLGDYMDVYACIDAYMWTTKIMAEPFSEKYS